MSRTQFQEIAAMSDQIIIASAARAPIGAFQDELASLTAPQLGAAAVRVAVGRVDLKPEQVEETIMGYVLPAGQKQTPARRTTSDVGLPPSTGCTTANKICGSGVRAAMNTYDALFAGSVDAVVADSVGSMTDTPYLIPKGHGGYRIDHDMIYDHMMLDGLEDAYDKGRAMGTFGEDCIEKCGFTREAQDHFTMTSVCHAQEATGSGAFRWEITPATVSSKAGDTVIDTDGGSRRIKVDKVPSLKPAFKKDDMMTAASSSPINDGATALVMMCESTVKQLGIMPLAVMLGHTAHAQAPSWFATAPATAIDKLFKRLDWNSGNVDLFEINEAFAVVPMAAMCDLHVPHEKVNVNGDACALDHPVGASDARVITALLGALQHRGDKRSVASLCISGGETTAASIELY